MILYGILDFIPALMVKKQSPVKIAVWAFLISSIIYGVIGFCFFSLPTLSNSDVLLLIVGSFLSAFGLLFFYKGLESGKASVVVPIASSWSIIGVLAGLFLLSESLNIFQLIGIPLVMFGTILVSFKIKELSKLRFSESTIGIKYALLTMLSWGFMFSIIGVVSKSLGWLWPVFITSAGSTVILFFYSLMNKIEMSFPRNITTQFSFYAILNAAAFLLFSVGLNYGSIAIISPIVAAAPLIVLVLARMVLHEKLQINQAVGVAIVLIGIVAVAI
jgi:transporter family protein